MTARTTRLSLLALAALVAGLAVYLLVGRGSSAARGPRVAGPRDPVAPGGTAQPAGSGAPELRAPGTTPSLPGAGPAEPGAVDGGVRTYVMDDGTVVRDHRKNGGEAPVATTPIPPEQRTLNPELSARVYQQLSPRVAECAAKVPAGARGADPFVYVNLTVEVDGDVLSTTSVVPVAHDVDDAAAGGLVSCVRDGLSTLRVDAKGEPDQQAYVLQYPIRLR